MINKKETVMKAVLWISAIFLIAWIVIPIYWTINVSFQTEQDAVAIPPYYFPVRPTFYNYWLIFHIEEAMAGARAGSSFFIPQIAASLLPSLRNSIIVATVVMIINMIVGSMAAHAFYAIKFPKRDLLFWITVLTRLMPVVVFIIPVFVMIRTLGLFDTLYALILIYSALTLPISIWIMYLNFQGYPPEFEEAAMLDGYSRREIFFKITMPMIKPAMFTVGLFAFIFSYGEFFFAFLLTSSDVARTMPVIISGMVGTAHMLVTIMMTGVLIGILPPLMLFIIFRHYILQGLMYYAGTR